MRFQIINVPNLRFPEFKEEWNGCTLANILKVGSGKDYKSLQEGDVPVYGSGGYMTSVNKYLHNGESVCIGRKGTINKPRFLSGKFWTVDTLFFTHSYHNVIPKFVLYLFENINWIKYNEASGVPSLSKATINGIEVNIPVINEQQQISTLLSLIDERISTQNKIIEDLKLLKSVIGDTIFNNNDWNTYSFSQLLSISNERNRDMQYSKVLSASQELGMIERNGINIDIKYNQDSTKAYKIARRGDYVLHLRSFQGGLAFAEYDGICSPAYTILRPSKLLYFGFLKNFFNSKRFIDSLRIVTYGIRDGRSINADEFLALKVHIPEINEQQKIANLFNCINSKIETNKSTMSAYVRQKEHLLRDMFI